MVKHFRLEAVTAIDLMTSYEICRQEGRQRAWNHLKMQKPLFAIGSPYCRECSATQRMQAGKPWRRHQRMIKEHSQAVTHHDLCMQLYTEHMQHGVYIINDRPASASLGTECPPEVARQGVVVTAR